MRSSNPVRRIRFWLGIFIAGLVLSGITAFPLQFELRWLVFVLDAAPLHAAANATGLFPWIDRVSHALAVTNTSYPFLAYGTDWLAFAHIVIAVAFLGPCFDPARNKWVITVGLIACAGVIPLALIAGYVRGIPIGWRLIDCGFGVFGTVPLLICRRAIRLIEDQTRPESTAVAPGCP